MDNIELILTRDGVERANGKTYTSEVYMYRCMVCGTIKMEKYELDDHPCVPLEKEFWGF
jgi:hypothetical protein